MLKLFTPDDAIGVRRVQRGCLKKEREKKIKFVGTEETERTELDGEGGQRSMREPGVRKPRKPSQNLQLLPPNRLTIFFFFFTTTATTYFALRRPPHIDNGNAGRSGTYLRT